MFAGRIRPAGLMLCTLAVGSSEQVSDFYKYEGSFPEIIASYASVSKYIVFALRRVVIERKHGG